MKFKFKLHLIYSFLLLLVVSCGEDKNEEEQGNFYNLKGFVTEQINLLTELKPVVSKKMMVGDSVETTQTTVIDWGKELELFAQADLNKPVNNLIYDTVEDSLGVIYTLKEGENAPVRFLKIVLNQRSQKPRSIEIKLTTKNQLYESQKNLSLSCGEVKGKWRILSYQVRGFQDLVMSDRKSFEIDAVVRQ
jgi:hypothetical protein